MRLSNLADWGLVIARRRQAFAVATKPLTGVNVSDPHLNFGVGQNDPLSFCLRQKLQKAFIPFLYFLPLRVLFR